MTLNEALALARTQGLDLIEIAPNAAPPVCRLVDYGKFLYEESKRTKESRARQTGGRMKEIQLSASISPHDLAVKLDHTIRFLCDDAKVRLKLRFRGRQKAHKEIGFEILNKFISDAAAYGQADAPPKMLGDRDLNVILSPLPRSKRARKPGNVSPDPAAVPPTAPGHSPPEGEVSSAPEKTQNDAWTSGGKGVDCSYASASDGLTIGEQSQPLAG